MQKQDYQNLRECPFCGAIPRVWRWGIQEHIVIECSNYDVDTHRVYMEGTDEEEVIKAWNRRAYDTEGR